jgi:uncharacterized RDD family membrane protein YckC
MQLLDTIYQVETPEGIDLHAPLAGPVPRILAYAIDITIRLLVILAVSIALAFAGNTGMGLILLISFLLEWFYPVFFEVYRQGQTPGKKYLALRVVNDDLTPVNFGTSLIRNLLRVADFFPLFYIGGIISMVLSNRFQRLGDLAAGTIVIHQASVSTLITLPTVLPRAPMVPLLLEDQIAIIEFTQRHNQLSFSRQQELANIIKQVLQTDDEHAVTRLQEIGCWLIGGDVHEANSL